MFAVWNRPLVHVKGEKIRPALNRRVNLRINWLSRHHQRLLPHDDGYIGWDTRRVHRAIRRDRPMQTAIRFQHRTAMPKRSIPALPLG